MVGPHAAIAAIALLASVASSPPLHEVSGSLASLAVGPSATVVTLVSAVGAVSVSVPAGVKVRERALGGPWAAVSLASLHVDEPVTALLDGAGRVTEVDAEYLLVDTRAVVMQDGYVVGTDGVAHKLVAAAATVTSVPLGAYVELRTDPRSGDAFSAAVSQHPFVQAAAVQAVEVTFVVRVPPNTPADATVYLATNAQNWTANAIRLSPQPGNLWSATIPLASGTQLQYKYTRGSWTTGERDASGNDVPNRSLTVATGATQSVDDVVARWADLPS